MQRCKSGLFFEKNRLTWTIFGFYFVSLPIIINHAETQRRREIKMKILLIT